MRNDSIKSCGKAHSYCRVCRPDVGAHLSVTSSAMDHPKCPEGCTCLKHKRWHHTEEAKAKIAERSKGEKNPFFGKKHSQELQDRINAKLKGRVPWNKGVTGGTHAPHSEETKIKMSERRKAHLMNHDPSCHCIDNKFKKGDPKLRVGHTMSEETKAKLRGPKSESHRLSLSEASKRRYENPEEVIKTANAVRSSYERPEVQEKYAAGMMGQRKKFQNPYIRTSLELKLRILLSEFPETLEQHWVGSKQVDIYLPEPYNLAFEADGSHWHTRTEAQINRDIKRDKYLLGRGVAAVIHLDENDLKSIILPKKT